jgi:hypothetical protein
MSLDPAQRQAVESWFRQKCPAHACPACGGRGWKTLDVVNLEAVALVGPGGVLKVGSSTAYESVVRACDNCAYLAHFLFQGITAGIAGAAP